MTWTPDAFNFAHLLNDLDANALAFGALLAP
jgi:hypothetical protein